MSESSSAHPIRFFLWVLLLSIPFTIGSLFLSVQNLSSGIPATAVMVVIPAAVATGFTFRERGKRAAWDLWHRVADLRCIHSWQWLVIAVFVMPAVSVLAYFVMRAFRLPLPSASSVSLADAPLLVCAYLFGAIFEEIGWTGYATEPLQQRYGLIGSGMMIGTVWAIWHFVPWWLGQGHAIWWVIGQVLATIAMRIVMGWIYTCGGRSLFLAILFHAMINTSWILFPNRGSHYNPLMNAAILAVLVGVIAISSAIRTPANGSGLAPAKRHAH